MSADTMTVGDAVARLTMMEATHAKKAANAEGIEPFAAQQHDHNARAIRTVLAALGDAAEWRAVYEPDVRLWQRVYVQCVQTLNDEDLGEFVREMAHDYYHNEKARMEARVGGAA